MMKEPQTSGCMNCTSRLNTKTTALTANTQDEHKSNKRENNLDHNLAAQTSIHNEIEKVKDLLRRPSVFRNSKLDSHELNLPNKH